ncbi:MAG: M1 family metallopeptidase, partial [Acidimicrobiales bacterium]
QYGNTETTDLWDAIEESAGEPVRRIMDSWILQGGHPVVTVDVSADSRRLHVSQQRFQYLPDEQDHTQWAIPLQLRYALESGEVVRATVLLDDLSLDIDLPEPVTWLVANAEGHGFYRVHVSGALREALVGQAQTVLSDVERYGLVDDTWASVLAGTTSVEDFLALADGFTGETDVSVWRRLLTALDQVDRLVEGPAREALQARVRALVTPALERLGWEPGRDDADRDRELRGALIGALANLGADPEARGRVRELFRSYCADSGSVEANVAAAVVRATAATAGADEIDTIIERFRRGDTPQEELRFLYSLSEVSDPKQMARVLDLAMSPEVRTQNAPFLIGSCIANRDNGALAWKLVEERWDEMNERFPSNSIVRMLSGIRSVNDAALAAAIEAFIAEHPVPQGQKSLEQHVERMQVSVQLRFRAGRAPEPFGRGGR